MEHLQDCMTCRETQLEAWAEDMQDPVTNRVAMTLIKDNPEVATMDVRPKPEWRPRQSEGAGDEAGQAGDEQRERLIVRRRKRVRQV